MISANTKGSIPVMFVLPTLGTGGSENVVFNLCKHLVPPYLPVVASFRGGAMEQTFKENKLTTHILHRHGGIDFTLVTKLRRLIQTYDVKIINTHHFVSLFYGFWAARFCGVPILHTEHSRWEMEALSSFWRIVFKSLLKRVQSAGAVSPAACEYMINRYGVNSDNVNPLQNGIDVDLFESGSERTVPRKALGLSQDDIILGTVGNFRSEKNQKLLVQALKLLNRREPRFRAVFVGDGPCKAEVERLSRILDISESVLFLGTQNEMHRYYGLFDIYCLTSRYEGLPLTLLEAMASGVPTIGTDVLGIRDLIRHDENGILVPDDNPDELSKAILRLSQDLDLQQRIRNAARRMVREHYSLAAFVNNYVNRFRLLISGCDSC